MTFNAKEVAYKLAYGFMLSWPPDREIKPLFLGPTQYISVLENALTEAHAAGVNEGLEKAAKVAGEWLKPWNGESVPWEIACEIRALKTPDGKEKSE